MSTAGPPRLPATGSVAGWGGLSVPGREDRSEDLLSLTKDVVLTRGLARSYGDSSLPPPDQQRIAGSVLADRLLSFDPATGVLRAEAGFSLSELNRLFLPRGYFSPVTPGTQFVTLGGMVAADVHGKNHHRVGCFGEHVRAIKLRVASGDVLECSREVEPELFAATIGGMGLTGHLLEVEFTLEKIASPWIWSESRRVANIDEYMDALKDSARDWPMTVGWIDCLSRGKKLGRGILNTGRWASAAEAPPTPPRAKPRLPFPIVAPNWLLNPLTIHAFNWAYYWKHLPKEKRGIVHPDSFFYPLDAITHWNRMYGRRGFTQYQCVLPEAAGRVAVRQFLELLTRLGGASFLCVIKDCGPEGIGLLSFPMPGTSIALDIPVREGTQRLIDALNEFVIGVGGRIYLAKDAFTRPEHFARMEAQRLAAFQQVREKWDPNRRIRSAQSVRLLGDPPHMQRRL